MKRVLITENIAPAGVTLLRESYDVTLAPGPSPEELLRLIPGYEALIVRSATKVTAEVLAAGERLAVVGRAGTGVDNVDLEAATRRGVIVVNAPASNTVAVAEHTIALMLSLARHLPQANEATHAGRWMKNGLMGSELRGKVLGLVGLGKVGAAVATRARALEMHLIAYDPFVAPDRAAALGVEMVSFEELLFRSDYISLHAPSTERTRGMIGRRELALVKPTARLINCARGDLVDEDELARALEEDRLAGAALDVFADEPHVSEALQGCPNAILTPHLGASTEEAQYGAALEVAHQVADVLEGRPPRYPVNVPALSSEELGFLTPYADLAYRLGRLYAQLAEDNLTRLEIVCSGELAQHDIAPLTASTLAGLLKEASDVPVNSVNARLIAQDRGLVVDEVRTSSTEGEAQIIVRATTTAGQRAVGGAVLRGRPHVVSVDGFEFDFSAEGLVLLSEHIEQPGVIGQVGSVLGERGISISFVQVARQHRGGPGMMALGLDDPVPEATLARLRTLPSVRSARVIRW